jgi:TolA-binding protein
MGLGGPRTAAALLVLGLGGAAWTTPALAQDDARLRKVEAEVKALQRAVFPGDGRFFTPEVTPGSPGQAQVTPASPPSTTALTDVLARLDALEGQVQRLTASGEEKDNALAQLQKRFDEAQAALAATQAPAESAEAPAVQPTGVIPVPSISGGRPTPTPASTSSPRATPPRNSSTSASATPRATPSPAASAPSAARVAAVRAIAKPQTGNTADDEYSYGYRLYDAGLFPEARQQLSLYLQKYPNDSKVSLGRNLLGRAYLDDGQPREAAKYFFENYQSNKQGARAPDSLLYLADSMIAINDTNRACIALAEFGDTYPALATGRLKEQYARTKSKVRCTK